MAVVIINPNSTAGMTAAMLGVAKSAAPGLEFIGWTSKDGPPSIQGAEDGTVATAPLLELVQQASDSGAEGIIIGCFDDTALNEAARLARCPVIGIGQAAYHYAALRQWRFSVVTTLAVSTPILEHNISTFGLDSYLGKVRASEVPVLDIEANPTAAAHMITAEALRAEQQDRIDAVILGCAGMVQVVSKVRDALRIATIDPVVAAARCMTWLV